MKGSLSSAPLPITDSNLAGGEENFIPLSRGGARAGGDFRGDRGDRGYSPERGRRHEMSPPPKRMRGGWGGDEDRYGGGGEAAWLVNVGIDY